MFPTNIQCLRYGHLMVKKTSMLSQRWRLHEKVLWFLKRIKSIKFKNKKMIQLKKEKDESCLNHT